MKNILAVTLVCLFLAINYSIADDEGSGDSESECKENEVMAKCGWNCTCDEYKLNGYCARPCIKAVGVQACWCKTRYVRKPKFGCVLPTSCDSLYGAAQAKIVSEEGTEAEIEEVMNKNTYDDEMYKEKSKNVSEQFSHGYIYPTKGGRNKKGKTTNLVCYTCLGLKLENCKDVSATCNGSCFKVHDHDHHLYVKGCRAIDTYDGEIRTSFELAELTSLWPAQSKAVAGTAYFCHTNLCNSAGKFTVLYTFVLCLICVVLFAI